MATSNPNFGAETSALEVASVFANRIQRKTIMITGASPTGVGGTVALALAGHQPVRLILTSRVASKLEPLISNIRAINPRIEIQAVELDLGSQHSIRQAAKDVLSSVSTIDILINNAGTANHPDRTLTAEGIEVHFATNHVGHFLLTCLLAPLLIKATAARVVGVSSIKHYMSPVRFSDYNFDGVKDLPFDERPVQNLMEMWKITPPEDYGYETMLCYSQSKTAVVLFGVGLSKRLSSMGVKAFSVHPGVIATDLLRSADPSWASKVQDLLPVKTPEQGAATTLVAALDPKLESAGGMYFSDCQIVEAASFARSNENADKLWTLSEKLVGESFEW